MGTGPIPSSFTDFSTCIFLFHEFEERSDVEDDAIVEVAFKMQAA